MKLLDQALQWRPNIDTLMGHVEEIAKWTRLSGSKEEERAFDYIESQVKSYGAHTTRITHDAYISLPESASLSIGGADFPCQTHSMAASAPPGGLEAEMIYLAGGKKDLACADVKGKIVMLDGRATGGPVYEAEAKGARGVVFISGERIYEMCISAVWGSPTPETAGLLPKIPAISVLGKTAEKIKRALARGPRAALLETKVDTGWRKIPLLTAEITGGASAKRFVMFSGHVDSWYRGATDNAAANAVMLETGRIAAERRGALKRGLRLVFFSGHSHGRYAGSSWYADNFWEDLHQNCCLNVNADVLGCVGATDVSRAVVMPETKGVVAAAVRQIAGKEFVGKRYARHADQSFWGAGVPSALASFSKQPLKEKNEGAFSRPKGGPDDLGWWWHTPEDTVDKIDPAHFLRDARIFSAVVLHFSMSEALPLNFADTVEELLESLRVWQKKAGGQFDLSAPIAKAKALKTRLSAYCAERSNPQGEDAARFNQTMLKLSRILTPLGYTRGKRYENDGALPLPPLPALMDIDRLASCADEEKKFLLVELVRRRVYVIDALNQAIEVLSSKA